MRKKIEEGFEVTWENMYLLGHYDKYTGRAYLTTWDGDAPLVDVVVTGCNNINIPMWGNPAPEGAEIVAIPEGKDPKEFAKEINGIHAFGWHGPTSAKHMFDKIDNGRK